MPSKSNQNKRSKDSTFKGYVNFYLSPSDKREIKKGVMSDEQIVKFLITGTDRGYKFGFTYDGLHGCYIVSATGTGADNPNLGYATTARHADFNTAVTALWYQLDVLSDGGLWDRPAEGLSEFDW